jgi:hypothetical protein
MLLHYTSLHAGVYCLSPGKYKFIIRDLFKDGICCDYGEGKYAGYLGGSSKLFSSPSSGDLEWAKRTHTFDIAPKTAPPTRAPTNKPTLPYQPKTTSSCSSTQRRAKIEIKTDKYGQETSWVMIDSQTGTREAESTKNYGPHEEDVLSLCLQNGRTYEFIIRDQWGDGMVSGDVACTQTMVSYHYPPGFVLICSSVCLRYFLVVHSAVNMAKDTSRSISKEKRVGMELSAVAPLRQKR